MGRKARKSHRNAFSFFLDEYVESAREQGRQVSRRVAAEECGPLWQELLPEEKEKYTQLATCFKEYHRREKEKLFTNCGISYADLEREQEELRLKVEETDTEIKMTISNLDSDLVRMHLFYIIHCNYYCKTDEGTYVPGELAVVEFSLGDGIRRTYHTLIDPGQLPLGFAFESKESIEQIHGLPYPPYEEGESDYCGILSKILDFLEPGRLPNGKYPPIYCNEKNIKASENILQALCDSCDGGQRHFRVYPVQKMFFWLKNKCVEYLTEDNVGFPVLSNAESEINRDVFCFTPGISCTFHLNSEEKYYNCSLSIVQRLVYIICDHCCQYVDVKLVPGKHCGLNCDTDREGTRARLMKSQMSFAAAPPSEVGESSFADDTSTLWDTREPTGSFLHEEIESSFAKAFDVSSVSSYSSRYDSSFEVVRYKNRRRARETPRDVGKGDTSNRLSVERSASFR